MVLITFLIVFGFKQAAMSQSTIASGGGNVASGGITVSYTIGQIFYTSKENTNIKVTEGVQQPYEIQTSNEIKEAEGIKLIMSVYPNPTNKDLTLIIENYSVSNLRYILFDISGKQLFAEKINKISTQISFSDYPASTYFIKITDSNKEIKTFKIIKTN